MESRSRGRGRGIQRTEVTKGERAPGGGGRGIVETSWRERESTTETEEPEAKAKRPEGLRSADPKLLRLGGPGRVESQVSVGDGFDAAIVAAFYQLNFSRFQFQLSHL